jgi:hypothetical protein
VLNLVSIPYEFFIYNFVGFVVGVKIKPRGRKMKLSRKNILMVVFLLLTACGALAWEDIYNAKDIAIPQSNVEVKEIEKAIVAAGAKRGWVMKKVDEGKMKGTLNIRRHVAVIFVTYNKKTFNIEYADSIKLHYDPKVKTIHKNYNLWVKNLENDIQVFLKSGSFSK